MGHGNGRNTYTMQLIPMILITSAACVGAHIAADELAYTYSNGETGVAGYLPKWWAKPLITCPTCMASVWGLCASVLFGVSVQYIPLFILSLAFTNTLFNRWVS